MRWWTSSLPRQRLSRRPSKVRHLRVTVLAGWRGEGGEQGIQPRALKGLCTVVQRAAATTHLYGLVVQALPAGAPTCWSGSACPPNLRRPRACTGSSYAPWRARVPHVGPRCRSESGALKRNYKPIRVRLFGLSRPRGSAALRRLGTAVQRLLATRNLAVHFPQLLYTPGVDDLTKRADLARLTRGQVSKWLKEPVCKTVRRAAFVGSTPTLPMGN